MSSGTLRRLARGVYAIGPRPDDAVAQWHHAVAAVVLAAGKGSVAARSTAAGLWGLDGFEPPTPIEVNVGRTGSHRSAGTHAVGGLEPPVTISGIAVSGLGQTLVELGAGLRGRRASTNDAAPVRPDELVELALESALRSGAVKEAELLDLLACHPMRRGARLLDEVLARRPYGAPPTESYLETRGIQVLRNGGVPTPRRQVELFDRYGRYVRRVDLLIGERVVVDFDGRAYHGFERDHEVWGSLAALGYLVVPATHAQVTERPRAFLDAVRGALVASAGG